MNVEFYTKENIIDRLRKLKANISGNPPLEIVKGLCFSDLIVINIESDKWKGVKENKLIKEMTKTITHEYTHSLIQRDYIFTPDGEETVCVLMANQKLSSHASRLF